MARKQFSIHYPDGSKKHIGAAEREQMLLAGEIRQIGNNAYAFKFVGETKTYNSFSDLADLRAKMEQQPNLLRRFLAGSFVIEYPQRLGGRKVRELLETPEAL